MKATKITYKTCLYRNNCFSVELEDGTQKKVYNFYLETLEDLIKSGLTFPIEVKLYGKGVLINDSRIKHKWYNKEFCTVCCPRRYLNEFQKLEIEREIARGQRINYNNSYSYVFGADGEF